ncbi:MAG TPA: hypothetical protein VHB98_10070 [Chloroflexota bacterium]|nr:hypothetical protein [Chloroflexota bacterium]
MLVLHGSWVLAQGIVPARFVIWGETTEPPRTSSAHGLRGARPSVPVVAHPFAPKTHCLVDVLERLRLCDEADVQFARSLLVQLPSAHGRPLPSPALVARSRAEAGGYELSTWRVDGLVFEAPLAATNVAALGNQRLADVVIGDDLRYWSAASRFVLALLCRQQLLPTVQQRDGAYQARWLPLVAQSEGMRSSQPSTLTEEGDARHVGRLITAMPPACRALAWDIGAEPVQPSVLLGEYVNTVVDAVARQALQRAALPRRGQLTAWGVGSRTWLGALRGRETMQGTPEELAELSAVYRAWAAPDAEDMTTGAAPLQASILEVEPGAAVPAPPLPLDPVTFWSLPAGFSEHTALCVAPAVDALPLKRLGTPSWWGSSADFMGVMEAWYHIISTEAQQLLGGTRELHGAP